MQNMEVSVSTALKFVRIVRALMKESPLKKVAMNELEAAHRELSNLQYENHPRECLTRVLCHLESAFTHFEPSTWNFLDNQDRLLWSQRTYKNSICLTIAVVHFYLGNTVRAKVWLIDEMSDFGWIQIPEGALSLLGFNSTKDFYSAVFGDNGEIYERIEWNIKMNNEKSYDDSTWNPLDASQNPYPF